MTDTPRTIADQALAILSADRGSAYADKLADWAQIRMNELATANARADRAERAERDLREEVSSTFRKYGLAAGPRAVEALIEERDKAVARALRAEAIEREVCEGRHVYLQQEMDEVAQRALKAEDERDAAIQHATECDSIRIFDQKTIGLFAAERDALAAQNAALMEVLQYVRPYCKAKYGMPEDIEERLDAAIYQRSI